MRIADIGEFALIERLRSLVAVERPDIIAGIGDDVAVLSVEGDEWLLATVDCQVEDVHFLRGAITPTQLGRRALAINLSDLAAMGGRPRFALVSLGLPASLEVAWVEELYRGLRLEAERHGVAIVGGNMTRSPAGIWIDLTVLGQVRRDEVVLRSGARPGDQVLVTGQLGAAAAGLQLLLDPRLAHVVADPAPALTRHFTPTPRLAEAGVIGRSHQATAMIDLSDGLSSDIGHICEQSGVGVRLWAAHLPIAPAARAIAAARGEQPWNIALSGGEDYELCFTASPTAAATLAAEIQYETGTPVTVVGEILPAGLGRWLQLPDGDAIPLAARGWEHFKRSGAEENS
ncbi:MAG: thiamine-phosphate kinase [Chloroflexaceae bacterium]